jgi:methionyl-tRNA synthetase
MSRFYITTPIFYVNGDPHLGTAYAAINADAFARWHRLRGDDTFFLTGTDEHGLKVAQTAAEKGVTPQEWVDKTSAHFKAAWRELNISYDDFIRTTEERHHRTVKAFLQRIYDRGYIYKGRYVGLYCVACEAYYQESELLDGSRCPVHNREVTEMAEDNYFFALSRFQDELLELYSSDPSRIFPEARYNEVVSFVKAGLSDISITRTSIDWGVKVPWDPEHVFYVWYDALINYLTAIGYVDDPDRFARWWPSVNHLLGKDIIRFHAVWWPAMCLAAGVDPPKKLLVHGWLLVDGEKMSKSLGNQIDPLSVARTLGADALRFFLLRANTFGADGDASLTSLERVYVTDLADDLGNLVSRVIALIVQRLDGTAPAVPELGEDPMGAESALERGTKAWDEFRPNEALDAAMTLIRNANGYLERNEPWKLPKGDPVAAEVLGRVREAVRLASLLLIPAMPIVCERIASVLGYDGHGQFSWTVGNGGSKIERIPPLFPKDRS